VTDTTYNDANRLGYEFLTEPTKDADTIENIDELTFTQDLSFTEPELVLFIQEPTSSVSATTIEGTDYKYVAFGFNDTADLVYNFTGLNNSQWLALVDAIPNSSRTAGNWYPSNAQYPGMFISPGEAFISIILPSGYTNIDITFGNQDTEIVEDRRVDLSINGVVKSTAYASVYKTYSQSYVTGDVLRIEEFIAQIHRSLIIRISSRQTQYTINFPEYTECDILIV